MEEGRQWIARAVIECLLAGPFRTKSVIIANSNYAPPAASQVADDVADLVRHVSDNWDASALHLAAYVLWRVNWIHPFRDGNGRTARFLSNVILCLKLGSQVPEPIVVRWAPFCAALRGADAAWQQRGSIEVSALEALLGAMLDCGMMLAVEQHSHEAEFLPFYRFASRA